MSYLPDLAWASPRAPLRSPYEGFSWYTATELVSPTVQEVQDATNALWDWIEQYIPKDSKLIVIGFSQGGLMATQLLRTRPERIQGTVILSGFMASGHLPGDVQLTTVKPRVIYARGLEDQAIPKTAISQLNIWLQTNTKAITKTYSALGHSVDSRVMNDVALYVQGQIS
jgi:phospholipase/carboxylesterase